MKSGVGEIKEQPDFFIEQQEKFLKEMGDMGFDVLEVKDLIEERGLPEYSQNLCIDALSNKDIYKNALFAPPRQHNANVSLNSIGLNVSNVN